VHVVLTRSQYGECRSSFNDMLKVYTLMRETVLAKIVSEIEIDPFVLRIPYYSIGCHSQSGSAQIKV
jgi:hypothetical protein